MPHTTSTCTKERRVSLSSIPYIFRPTLEDQPLIMISPNFTWDGWMKGKVKDHTKCFPVLGLVLQTPSFLYPGNTPECPQSNGGLLQG